MPIMKALYKKNKVTAMNGQTYYHLDGTVDWLKTIVKTTITYKDSDVVVVDSVSAPRAQRMYYRRTAILDSLHEMRVMGEQIENIFPPLNHSKTLTETLQDINEDLQVAWDMFGRYEYMAQFEECSADDILKALEANISEYNGAYDG